jgi:hypothetical protein
MRVLALVAPNAACVDSRVFDSDIARGSRPVKPAKQKHNRTWPEKDERIL